MTMKIRELALVGLTVSMSVFISTHAFGQDPAPSAPAVAAPAVPVVSADTDPSQLAIYVLDAITHKNWGLLASLALVGIVMLLRMFGKKISPKLGEVMDNPIVAFALPSIASSAGAIATSLIAGKSIDFGLVLAAISHGLIANAMYVGGKKIQEAKELGAAKAAAVETKADAVDVLKDGPKP